MLCKPLDAPLASLHPDTPVFVVRYGLVYVYPADLLLDIANDRYVPVDLAPWAWRHHDVSALYIAWQLGAALDARSGRKFDIWYESLREGDSRRCAGAAYVAANKLINFETFRHRHLPDGGYHRNTTTG
ncbi:hypothetical protein [Xanthomonas phage NEB7]|nr:hypothetical protein [Xanthomonas phage NEB7]